MHKGRKVEVILNGALCLQSEFGCGRSVRVRSQA